MENYKMIDYDCVQGSSPCNGNLSNVDGGFEAHWNYEGGGGTVTEARALTDGEFALLWDGIAASVGGGGAFGRCLVNDLTRLVDPDLHHVITATQMLDGRLQHRMFMVPSSEDDPAFVAWLDNLAVPIGARRGASVPEQTDHGAVRDAKIAARQDRVLA